MIVQLFFGSLLRLWLWWVTVSLVTLVVDSSSSVCVCVCQWWVMTHWWDIVGWLLDNNNGDLWVGDSSCCLCVSINMSQKGTELWQHSTPVLCCSRNLFFRGQKSPAALPVHRKIDTSNNESNWPPEKKNRKFEWEILLNPFSVFMYRALVPQSKKWPHFRMLSPWHPWPHSNAAASTVPHSLRPRHVATIPDCAAACCRFAIENE
jgi:hypothetical protein